LISAAWPATANSKLLAAVIRHKAISRIKVTVGISAN